MSINIVIDNKFVITSDQFQFILQEKKIAKSGKNAVLIRGTNLARPLAATDPLHVPNSVRCKVF